MHESLSTPVMDLVNIGKKIAGRLNEIGINTKGELQRIGAVEAHRQIKSRYPGETLPVCYYLYSFEGAILDQHWNDIPDRRKTELKQAIEPSQQNAPSDSRIQSDGPDKIIRCSWVSQATPEEQAYHDNEWGRPVHDDRLLFEFLLLEGAQAGLSWSTILKKRAGYRQAFDNFDAQKIARYSDKKIAQLLQNPKIIRNRLKVNAAVTNAKLFLELQKEYGSFDAYIWSFVDGRPIRNKWENVSAVPASTAESDAMSKDLKKRGFKFVGTTICYAFMQAVGMVNDHTTDCFCFQTIHELS